MNWITYAILVTSFYGFFNFFIKLFSDKISPSIALMIMAGTSFIFATIATLVLKYTGQGLVFIKKYYFTSYSRRNVRRTS